MSFFEFIRRLLFVAAVFAQLGCAPANEYVPHSANVNTAADAVNINTATADVLRTLPGIGRKNARAIIEHREKNGPFRRVEHLMLIDGIGEKSFRKMRHLITVDPSG